MPYFAYRGRNQHGALIEGVVESNDSRSLASSLIRQDITPIEIKQKQASVQFNLNNIDLFKEKIDTVDVMLFSRQMHTLLKSGIPIMKALEGLQVSTTNKELKRVISEIYESLDSGRELSTALKAHPEVFDHFYLSMISVGESTGLLENVFLRMFDHQEFQRFMNDQVKAALRYPTFVMLAMAIAIIIVNIMVIPAFAKVFATMGSELPILTKSLLAISNFMISYWPFLIVFGIISTFGFKHYTNTSSGRFNWDVFKLKLPIAGKIVHKAAMARFARSYSLAATSGVPITETLNLVSKTVENAYLASKINEMRDGVQRGENILSAATSTGVFSTTVLQMIAVGEESGALAELMNEVADLYQRDVEYEIKTLATQIEPVMIFFMGALVLLLALGIFLPVWDLGSIAIK